MGACGPQTFSPALLKGFGATGLASSASAQRPLYCRASGSRPGRVGCACILVTPVAGCRGSIPAPATGPARGAGPEAEADRWRDAGKLGAAVPAVRMALRRGRHAPAHLIRWHRVGFRLLRGANVLGIGREIARPDATVLR